MGRIDNEKLTLKDFTEPYIRKTKDLRIFTGCVNIGPLIWLLESLPQYSPLAVIAGSIAPDLRKELDNIFERSLETGMLGGGLKTGKLRLGFHPEVHMKVWLFNLNWAGRRPYLTISGSSNLTWQGLAKQKGEQNDRSRGRSRFLLEESRWEKFTSQTTWLSKENWGIVRKQCWKGSNQDKRSISSGSSDFRRFYE